jgi:hypothetical protein
MGKLSRSNLQKRSNCAETFLKMYKVALKCEEIPYLLIFSGRRGSVAAVLIF